MRTIWKTILVAVIATFVSLTAYAQDNARRISREAVAEKQAEYICETLAFDSATSKKFKDTYRDFHKELWALGPSLGKQQTENPTEDEIAKRFERSQKILDLRKKYYGIYSTFLTQKQISRVYEIERDMMRRLSSPKQPVNNKQKRNAQR